MNARIRRGLFSELRSFVQTTLPDYMVPSAFVLLDSLPLSANGKLDRKALPAPDYPAQENTLAGPRDIIETRLSRIWQQVLGGHVAGVTDNFFESGGDSLLGTHLFLRVEEEFGRRLPLGTLFEAPTIEKLAAILRQDSWASGLLLQVQPGDASVPPMFFVEARVGYRALGVELGAHQPFYVVPYDDLFVHKTERSLTDMAAELARRIRSHQPRGPYHLGGMCMAGYVAFAVARELWRAGDEVALLAVIDMPVPQFARPSGTAVLRSTLGRLRWHVSHARAGNRQQKMQSIAASVRGVNWQAKYRAWKLARAFFRALGRPLPQSLRHSGRLMAQAVAHDLTTSYPGRITLFRPRDRVVTGCDRWDLGWGEIAAGGLDIFEISGAHHTLLREHVTEVGQRLRQCLERAQKAPAAVE